MWNPKKLLFKYLNSIYTAKAVNLGVRFYPKNSSNIYHMSSLSNKHIESEIKIVFGKDAIWNELSNEWCVEQETILFGEIAEYLSGSKIVYNEGNFIPSLIKNGNKISKKMFVDKFVASGISREYLMQYYDNHLK